MDSTRSNSSRSWAQQIYGPPMEHPLNLGNVVEQLVRAKHLRDCSTSDPTSTSGYTSPSEQAATHGSTSSNDTPVTWYDDSWNDDFFCDPSWDDEPDSGASTPKSTHESNISTTDPTRPSSATNNKSAPVQELSAADEDTPPPPPGYLSHMPRWIYSRMSRLGQLEYLVRLKIKTFRERMGAPYSFENVQLWIIDNDEQRRRRRFFKRNGEEAFLACYVNSDYVGRVEFHYINPEEVY